MMKTGLTPSWCVCCKAVSCSERSAIICCRLIVSTTPSLSADAANMDRLVIHSIGWEFTIRQVEQIDLGRYDSAADHFQIRRGLSSADQARIQCNSMLNGSIGAEW